MEEFEKPPQEGEIIQMIYTTMRESLDSLTKSLDGLKALPDMSYGSEEVERVIEQTRRFVVFAKYSGDYLRRTTQTQPLREEMLKIKLHLLSVLRSLVDSVKIQDHAAVHDLLTEELRDNLTLWKIKILPLLRPLRSLTSGSPRT